MDRYSFLNAVHPTEIESLYEKYLTHPDSVEPSWRAFFQGHDFGVEFGHLFEVEPATGSTPAKVAVKSGTDFEKEIKVLALIDAYRQRGHLFTKTNPVRQRRTYSPTLDIQNFGLTQGDLDQTFQSGNVLGLGVKSLRDIVAYLEEVFCDAIGVEYIYMRHPNTIQWMEKEFKQHKNKPTFTDGQKRLIYKELSKAVGFENFLHKKYVGQKRFSLEGNETFIPGMYALVEDSADAGVQEFVIGMAHRGRLNMLANIFDKPVHKIFNEFEGKDYEEEEFDGDVKYHMGSTAHKKTLSGKDVTLNLVPNPSHLETVAPVVQGIARAKIEEQYNNDESKVLPIVVHGDAAVAGQGIAYEVTQMAQLDGYRTGGTVHIVINNQVGFTTNYTDARSSTYCTDVAKVTLSPVLHVNADDVEAVVHAMQFAMRFRMEFNRDVFVDLLGYRKYGHNEGDEPRFTQPILYKLIAKHPNSESLYKNRLIAEGKISNAEAEEFQTEHKDHLESEYALAKSMEKSELITFMAEVWEKYPLETCIESTFKDVDTTVDGKVLEDISKKLTTLPSDKKVIRKLERLVADRAKMLAEDRVDWGMAELLTYGSLLNEGHGFRLSGQDVERGTFSHRHAVMKVEDSEEEIFVLDSVKKDKQPSAYNSFLSEYAVMGFDYGYALGTPDSLTIWEAQFGDFSNGAQIMIDQYLSAAEDKWKLQNGLVLLLPHGYEGQGAEHSSARLERYLQLCAQNNMQVLNCTTPANLFHALRRQMKNTYRKPMVIFSPKSLLRHPKCISTKKDFTDGKFQFVIDRTQTKKKVKKLVFCTGKFYYDLLKYQEDNKRDDVAIVTIEQLYPFPKTDVQAIIDHYKAEQVIWTQEEPANMGAWGYLLLREGQETFKNVTPVLPIESAAPAPGSSIRHGRRHAEVIEKVFSI